MAGGTKISDLDEALDGDESGEFEVGPRSAHAELSDGYRVLLRAMGDAVMVADATSGRFLQVNAAATALLGYRADEFAALTCAALHPPGHDAEVAELACELDTEHQAYRAEVMLQRKDGSCFWAQLHQSRYDGARGPRLATVLRDVTDQVVRNRELRRAHAELEVAHAQMLHTNKLVALGQIAAGVAHEVNNPASYVLMNLDEVSTVLHRGESAFKSLRTSLLAWLDGEQRERAQECLAAFPVHQVFREGADLIGECTDGVQRITSLVKDLRGFARIDEADVAVVTLNEIVVTACKIVGPHLRQRAHLETRLESTHSLAADRRRLVQVITNLLVNAGQALEEGFADAHRIVVTTRDEADCVVVRVQDTGPGIDAEILERIFDPFFTTKRERGTGLGLSLCADIVRQHGGSVGAFSSPGKGATFEVRVPFDTGLLAPQPVERPSAPPAHPTCAQVLVIDDEPQLVRAYRRILGRHHDVTVAIGGAAGLGLIEKNPHFDVVLCDLMMPDVDGVRIFNALERIAPHLRERVIFSSGGAFTRRAEELISSISNRFLEKPVDAAELLSAVEEVYRAARSTRSEPAPLQAEPPPSPAESATLPKAQPTGPFTEAPSDRSHFKAG